MSQVFLLPPEDGLAADGTRTAGWWVQAAGGERVVCQLCPRGCSLAAGDRGFCFVRENRGGRLVSNTYGRSTGFAIDPIEKKPLNHFYPGTAVLSFGTAGCNLGCKFCQNWTTTKSRDVEAACEPAQPEAIAEAAVRLGCPSVAFTYNDPIVWIEYAIATARACRQRGVKTVAVTSGYMNPAPREALYEHIDAANVDLKGFSEDFYRKLAGGHLEPVLDTLRWLVRHTQVWLEITNLVIPHENDSPEEIQRMCQWIAAELGPDVPLHFSAFHPDFKLTDHGPTPPETLVMAYDIARRAGLRYVYTGNVVDRQRQATYCHGCGRSIVVRDGYRISEFHVAAGKCPDCGAAVAGRFDTAAGTWGGRRTPVRIADYAPPTPRNASCAAAPATLLPYAVPRPAISPEQERRIFAAAGQRVAATVLGRPLAQTMDALLGDVAEKSVYGVFVSLKCGKRLRSCCGFIGETVPLWEAVDHAAVRAAKDDPRFPRISSSELADLDMEVWLLWGLEPVAARGDDRAAAVQIGTHGLQISRGAARGLLLPSVAVDHRLDARGFLRQVCLKAGLPPDAWQADDATLMTFEGYAIRDRLATIGPAGGLSHFSLSSRLRDAENGTGYPWGAFAQSSQQPAGTAIRQPAWAGAFYPASRGEIDAALQEMFAAAGEVKPQPWYAALVPHAGWMYSGSLAAATLARVEVPQRVIVVCPKHHPGGAEWAVAPWARWALPGGEMAADPDLARRLAEGVAGLELDAVAHHREHAIEVQLPLLARLAPAARVVGIAIGEGGWTELRRFAEQLAAVLGELPDRPLLVISSDMNHYANEAETRRLDRLALDAIEERDPAKLFDTVQRHRISMCGMRPAVIVLETLRQLGALNRVELVGHTTSAERSGDRARVVGYAGVLFG